jgi:hypothetical protein
MTRVEAAVQEIKYGMKLIDEGLVEGFAHLEKDMKDLAADATTIKQEVHHLSQAQSVAMNGEACSAALCL